MTSANFLSTGGVRQGDVLSPLLFNSVLESAIQSWKRKLSSNHGVALVLYAEAERMTNIRFADDLLSFAKSMEEAVQMADFLVAALGAYGLKLNMRKTKYISTTPSDNDTTLIETDHGFVELVPAECVHKYLGRGWSGNLRHRGQAAIGH